MKSLTEQRVSAARPVTSQGESVEDALKNLREALELYFEDQPFPDRIDTPIIAPVDILA